jgi:hypothetical protein
MYSIERLQALQEYCQKASRTRVVLVCMLTPLPSLVAIIAIEAMPLRSPFRDGWRHDAALWVRVGLTAFIITLALSIMVKNKIPELRLSMKKGFVISVGSTLGYLALVRAIADSGVFPIPFLLVTGMIPLILFSAMMMVLVVGINLFRVSVGLRAQLKWFAKMLLVKTLLLILYPAYSALFKPASTLLQNTLVLGLIVLKIVLKNLVSRAAEHLEDYIPIIVILLVDLFNALYLTVSMQTASSTTTGMLIIGSDWIQLLWTLRGIHRRTRALRELLQLVISRNVDAEATRSTRADFIAIVLRISARPDQLDASQLRKIRLRACLDQHICAENLIRLQQLESMRLYADGRRARLAKFVAAEMPRSGGATQRERGLFSGRRLSIVSVIPIAIGPRQASNIPTITEIYRSTMRKQSVRHSARAGPVLETREPDVSFSAAAANHKTRLLFQTLQMLFHTEYLVLLEYVECIIPLMYVIYFSVMRQLPNAAHYAHLSESTSTIQNVLPYALVEVLSLGIIHAALRRTFHFSPMYQLAFVLENQAEFVQSKLMLWIVILLQFQLTHYGGSFAACFRRKLMTLTNGSQAQTLASSSSGSSVKTERCQLAALASPSPKMRGHKPARHLPACIIRHVKLEIGFGGGCCALTFRHRLENRLAEVISDSSNDQN